MRKHGHPTWSMVGVAVAVIILAVAASRTWFPDGSLAVSAAVPVSASRTGLSDGPVVGRRTPTAPRWQPGRTDREPPQRLMDYVAPRRTAPAMPPGADRVFRDPSLVEAR